MNNKKKKNNNPSDLNNLNNLKTTSSVALQIKNEALDCCETSAEFNDCNING